MPYVVDGCYRFSWHLHGLIAILLTATDADKQRCWRSMATRVGEFSWRGILAIRISNSSRGSHVGGCCDAREGRHEAMLEWCDERGEGGGGGGDAEHEHRGLLAPSQPTALKTADWTTLFVAMSSESAQRVFQHHRVPRRRCSFSQLPCQVHRLVARALGRRRQLATECEQDRRQARAAHRCGERLVGPACYGRGRVAGEVVGAGRRLSGGRICMRRMIPGCGRLRSS